MRPWAKTDGRWWPWARTLVPVLVVAGVLVVGTAPAMAHARLRGSQPTAATTVVLPPAAVRLLFTEVVETGQSQVLVTGPDGRPVHRTRTQRDPLDARVLVTALPAGLTPGTYVVSWRVLSVDGHPVSSSLRFAVGAATTPLTSTASVGLGPTVLGGSGRALVDVSLLSLVGLTAFPLLALRRGGTTLTAAAKAGVLARLRAPLAIALLGGLLGNALLAVDTASQARGFPSGRVSSHLPELYALLRDSHTGHLLVLREIGLLAVAGTLALGYGRSRSRARLRPRAAAVHLAGVVALLATVSLASHAGSASVDLWVATAIDWTHLVAAGAWTGGLLALSLAGLPTARSISRLDAAAGAEQAGALTAGFSDLAQLCMLVVLVTGTYQTLVHVTTVGELGGTAWGAELVAKLALWATVLLVATATTASLVPRVTERASAASARLAACGELTGVIRFELAAAVALIAVAAVLAGTAPPDQLT